MHRPFVALALLLVLVSSCERRTITLTVEPVPSSKAPHEERFIQGIVRQGDWNSPPGPVVSMARVWLAGDFAHSVYTDSLGRYALPVDPIGADSLTVFAANGYTPGMVYGNKCQGLTKLLVASWGAVNVEIRLDRCSPI